jgi:hypothetical protein
MIARSIIERGEYLMIKPPHAVRVPARDLALALS